MRKRRTVWIIGGAATVLCLFTLVLLFLPKSTDPRMDAIIGVFESKGFEVTTEPHRQIDGSLAVQLASSFADSALLTSIKTELEDTQGGLYTGSSLTSDTMGNWRSEFEADHGESDTTKVEIEAKGLNGTEGTSSTQVTVTRWTGNRSFIDTVRDWFGL